MSEAIDYIRKIKALADRGEGGEAINAQKLFFKMCEKHGIDPYEIDEEKTKEFTVTIPKELRWLYIQTYMQVTQAEESRIWSTYKPNRYIVECKESDFVLIGSMYQHYKNELGKQIDIMKTAFIIKNKLWSKNTKTQSKELTKEQQDQLDKAFAMANNMEVEGYLKRIGKEK